jgi:hypothetical protein
MRGKRVLYYGKVSGRKIRGSSKRYGENYIMKNFSLCAFHKI